MNTPEVPEHHYTGVGRVAVAASMLESMIAQVAVAAGLDNKGRDWVDILSTAGGALRALEREVKTLPANDKLKRFYVDSVELLGERNKLIHSLLVFEFPDTPGESSRWLLHHPRTRQDRELPDPSEYAELARRLMALGARGLWLQEHLADSLRTEDGPDA